jgi:hypothetical protein
LDFRAHTTNSRIRRTSGISFFFQDILSIHGPVRLPTRQITDGETTDVDPEHLPVGRLIVAENLVLTARPSSNVLDVRNTAAPEPRNCNFFRLTVSLATDAPQHH